MGSVSESPGSEPVPHPPSSQEVAFLIGLMAVLEGEYLSGSVGDDLMQRIGLRFKRVGLLDDGFGNDDVRSALKSMNYRLRHARGEKDEPPM